MAFIVAFLAPAILIYGGFVIWPLIQALIFSTYRWRGVSARKAFIGLENFQRLAADADFWQTILHNILILVFGGVVVIALAVAVAHAMKEKTRATGVLRSFYLFPQMISTVIVAVMWQFILDPQGLFNAGLQKVGLGKFVTTWLGTAWALPSVGVAFVWWAVGFYIMLFSAGIQGISGEVQEAAELDGSHGWHRFKNVTWPLLWSVKRVAVVYLVINVMNMFALVFLMTRGGPDRKSEVMLTYLYEQAFVNSQFGYATAMAVGNFVVVMGLSLLVLAYFRKDPTERTA